MKIALGMRIQHGPFGGGNRFGTALRAHLTQRGATVADSLRDDDIDLILVTEPRWWHESCAFDMEAAVDYRRRHPRTLIVYRVNECDERKGVRGRALDRLIGEAVRHADRTVFISGWLRDLYFRRGCARAADEPVILNGADSAVFNRDGVLRWDGTGPLRLVTHHWGGNWFKGFDVYTQLDALLADEALGRRLEFTFVGNVPRGVRFRHARVVAPLSGPPLAAEIKRHHVYVTATRNEPAGMHHVEGAMCGLPLLYRTSGALPEYCDGFGIPFTGPEDFAPALARMRDEYGRLFREMEGYRNTAEAMCRAYADLIEDLLRERDAVAARRRPRTTLLLRLLRLGEYARQKRGRLATVPGRVVRRLRGRLA